MDLSHAIEAFVALAVFASSISILLAVRGTPLAPNERLARIGAWGLGLAGVVALTGGLATQEAALLFGGLCLVCLAMGLEAPSADLA